MESNRRHRRGSGLRPCRLRGPTMTASSPTTPTTLRLRLLFDGGAGILGLWRTLLDFRDGSGSMESNRRHRRGSGLRPCRLRGPTMTASSPTTPTTLRLRLLFDGGAGILGLWRTLLDFRDGSGSMESNRRHRRESGLRSYRLRGPTMTASSPATPATLRLRLRGRRRFGVLDLRLPWRGVLRIRRSSLGRRPRLVVPAAAARTPTSPGLRLRWGCRRRLGQRRRWKRRKDGVTSTRSQTSDIRGGAGASHRLYRIISGTCHLPALYGTARSNAIAV